jgi:hypothetical protein
LAARSWSGLVGEEVGCDMVDGVSMPLGWLLACRLYICARSSIRCRV